MAGVYDVRHSLQDRRDQSTLPCPSIKGKSQVINQFDRWFAAIANSSREGQRRMHGICVKKANYVHGFSASDDV
jgi:hypothetical protein